MFANSFGLLGTSETFGFLIGAVPRGLVSGERLDDWKREVSEMKGVVDLLVAVREVDTEKLQRSVQWNGSWVDVRLYPEPEPTQLEVTAPWDRSMERGDTIQPVLHVIQAKVNEKIKKLSIIPQLTWGYDLKELRMQLSPNCLLGAMWVQLFNAIHAERDYIQCAGCKEWFELHTQVRPNQLSCSEACKARVYRMRKKERVKGS